MMSTVNGLTEGQVARIAEVVIGLGVKPDDNCLLCRQRAAAGEQACPTHVGAEIARWVFRDRSGSVIGIGRVDV